MNNKHTFPELPGYKAIWAPIYMEPIVQSGERITIGVAAIGKDKNIRVVQTVAEQKLRCVFGKAGAEAIANMTNLCVTALSLHLSQEVSSKSFNSWIPPMAGIYIGKSRNADGSNIDEIINTALKLCSCFAVPKYSSHLLSVDEESVKQDDQWMRKVRSEVSRSAPQLKHSFRKRLHLIENGRAPIYDFLGSHYVANFGRINPKRIAQAVAIARAKLWTLGVAREDRQLYQIPQDRYELIVWNPLSGVDPQGIYSPREIEEGKEGYAEIKEEASRKELKVQEVSTPLEASRHIITMELVAA